MNAHKILVWALSTLLLFSFSGCGNISDAPSAVSIDEYEWSFSTLQTGEDGAVIACSKQNKAAYKEAAELEMDCAAKDGILTLNHLTNGTIFQGTYRQTGASGQTAMYEITFGEESGTAASSVTIYSDGSETPTLVLTVGHYSLQFFAEL